MKYKAIFLSMRLPFLILTPVCILLGASVVMASHTNLDLLSLSLALIGALLAHISVNTLNEYFDFESGLDLLTKRTDFSGGSGGLPQQPELKNHVLIVGVVSLFFITLIGVYFYWRYGVDILPIGIIGLLIVVTYTQWINKSPFLCLIAPGFAFGFLMVMGTQFVLVGKYWLISILVAVIPFFLVNNLLLLNQYPDIEADKKVGRRHFPIAYGVKNSNIVYGFFTLASALAIIIYVIFNFIPVLSLIALIPLFLSFFSLSGAIKYKQCIGEHPQYLSANVAATILTPLLLSISIIVGG
jgi:1,4-dihydroxy-2-naphthoate octaprenyltransferase